MEKAGIQIVEEPASFPWASVEKPLSQLVDPEGEARVVRKIGTKTSGRPAE